MSWAEVKKINNNLNETLDNLIIRTISKGYRNYFYESTTFTIPFSGTYTIRAFCGSQGSYGKVIKNFTEGEILTITITGTTALTVTSNLQDTTVFHINLALNSYVNSNSSDSIMAIAIGGAGHNIAGGNAYVRSNNGIAAGGGGAGCPLSYGNNNNAALRGRDGGSAYAWGNNVYALGGGGGGAVGSSSSSGANRHAGGIGGSAFVNDVEITTYCSITNLVSGRGYNGNANYNRSSSPYTGGGNGGNGGCGGGGGSYSYNRGFGFFSDGGWYGANTSGASAGGSGRGGAGGRGYFAGGNGGSVNAKTGGAGGFIGGAGFAAASTRNNSGGTGGYSAYGIGGNGGTGNANYSGGKGGDGRIMGGTGGTASNGTQGVGGNGYTPGTGKNSGIQMDYGLSYITLPASNTNAGTSIVIIEYGESLENF